MADRMFDMIFKDSAWGQSCLNRRVKQVNTWEALKRDRDEQDMAELLKKKTVRAALQCNWKL